MYVPIIFMKSKHLMKMLCSYLKCSTKLINELAVESDTLLVTVILNLYPHKKDSRKLLREQSQAYKGNKLCIFVQKVRV